MWITEVEDDCVMGGRAVPPCLSQPLTFYVKDADTSFHGTTGAPGTPGTTLVTIVAILALREFY